MTRVFLVRHGNIDMANRVPGRLAGVSLSSTGREQVVYVAQRIADCGIDQIFCSPLDRCIETASIIGSRCGVEPQKRDNLIEIDFGEWTGQRFDELESDERWKRFHAFRSGCRIPGGELMIEVQNRMINEIERIVSESQGKRIVIVSHNDPIKSAVAWYAGMPLELFLRIEISTASVSTVEFGQSHTRVLLVNGTGPGF